MSKRSQNARRTRTANGLSLIVLCFISLVVASCKSFYVTSERRFRDEATCRYSSTIGKTVIRLHLVDFEEGELCITRSLSRGNSCPAGISSRAIAFAVNEFAGLASCRHQARIVKAVTTQFRRPSPGVEVRVNCDGETALTFSCRSEPQELLVLVGKMGVGYELYAIRMDEF